MRERIPKAKNTVFFCNPAPLRKRDCVIVFRDSPIPSQPDSPIPFQQLGIDHRLAAFYGRFVSDVI